MKTKLILFALLLTLVTVIALPGCPASENDFNFGETGPKEYQTSLSEMSDQAIRDRIDELHGKMCSSSGTDYFEYYSWIASIIKVYQNELILRQLEGKTTQDGTGDKQSSKSLKDKLQAKGIQGKQDLQGKLEKQGAKGH